MTSEYYQEKDEKESSFRIEEAEMLSGGQPSVFEIMMDITNRTIHA